MHCVAKTFLCNMCYSYRPSQGTTHAYINWSLSQDFAWSGQLNGGQRWSGQAARGWKADDDNRRHIIEEWKQRETQIGRSMGTFHIINKSCTFATLWWLWHAMNTFSCRALYRPGLESDACSFFPPSSSVPFRERNPQTWKRLKEPFVFPSVSRSEGAEVPRRRVG